MRPQRNDPFRADPRAEFRRFVLEHHPDRGGDPRVFHAGLAAYRATGSVQGSVPRPAPTVSASRRRRGPVAVINRLRRARQARRRRPRVR